MSSSRRPWYKWFPKDFTSDEKVRCLSPIAELIYRRALDLMWQSNSICLPNAMPLLYQALGAGIEKDVFDDAWSRIQYINFELLKVSDDGKWLFSKRLRREAQELEEQSNKKQAAGIKGASKRWSPDQKHQNSKCHNSAIANAQHPHSDKDTDIDTDIKNNTPLPPKGENGRAAYSESFESWWKEYPAQRRINKKSAYKRWQAIGKSKEATVAQLTDALKSQVANNHFVGTDGQDYIPAPDVWLNKGKWLDEIKKTSSSPAATKPKIQPPKEFDFANQFHTED